MTIAAQIGRVNANLEITSRSKDFAETCRVMMLAKGNYGDARHFASASPRRVQEVFATKADVAGGTTGNMDPLADYRPLSEGFVATLANVSAFDGILTGGANVVPLHTQFAVTVTDVTASSVGEGTAKRIASMSLDGLTLQERRAATIVAVSDDLLKFNNAAGLLENSMRTGVAASVDSTFLTAMIAGTTPIAATANVFTDLKALTDATGSGPDSKFHLVVAPVAARQASSAINSI